MFWLMMIWLKKKICQFLMAPGWLMVSMLLSLLFAPGSPAEKAGLVKGDIILEINGEKISKSNSLAKIISRYNPKETITLKILRNKQEIIKNVVLGEWE